MKRVLFVISITLFSIFGWVACSPSISREPLLGKWSLDVNDPIIVELLDLQTGRTHIEEYKEDGELVFYDVYNDHTYKIQRSYFKMIDDSTYWLCQYKDNCAGENAFPITFRVNGNDLYIIDNQNDPPITFHYIKMAEGE